MSAIDQKLNQRPFFTSSGHELTKCSLLFDSLATDILGQGSNLRFRAHGNSMTPFIRNGDIIMVEPKKASELRVGDVVFYRKSGGRHIAHRLVSKSENNGSLALTTKGDNLKHFDAPVSPEQVLGRVIRIQSQVKELWLGGRMGLGLNRLLLYASPDGSYVHSTVRRGLAWLWWLSGRKRKR